MEKVISVLEGELEKINKEIKKVENNLKLIKPKLDGLIKLKSELEMYIGFVKKSPEVISNVVNVLGETKEKTKNKAVLSNVDKVIGILKELRRDD